ncbi:hypothetical protein A2U01_0110020, partial [Trifolium medium]|nr:hypothetical protein [Trifolium medium]
AVAIAACGGGGGVQLQ